VKQFGGHIVEGEAGAFVNSGKEGVRLCIRREDSVAGLRFLRMQSGRRLFLQKMGRARQRSIWESLALQGNNEKPCNSALIREI
jgi:hypothetical protein